VDSLLQRYRDLLEQHGAKVEDQDGTS
jgi:hypothetical protein